MDYERESKAFRAQHSTGERTADARLGIDPGFVHHRKIQALLGPKAMAAINMLLAGIPDDAPDFIRSLQTDHAYARVLTDFCAINGVPTLAQLLGQQKGQLFASVETTLPTPDVWDQQRIEIPVQPKGETDFEVRLRLSTDKIAADTTKSELANGSEMAMVAQLREKVGSVLIFEPMLLGGPMVQPENDAALADAAWLGFAFGEVFVEDVDEFAKVADTAEPTDIAPMEHISERAFKQCLAELLAQMADKDWGGEQSDLFTAHLRLGGTRMSAAFLLKGPAHFAPMGLNHLGKNNDQIVRLSQEPARLLVVQHCHEILPAVRETLRAFTIRPGTLDRRYCLIDGKDSLRLLDAYGLRDKALELTVAEKAARKT